MSPLYQLMNGVLKIKKINKDLQYHDDLDQIEHR